MHEFFLIKKILKKSQANTWHTISTYR